MNITRTLTIVNEKGLHARASAKFVETVENFNSEVRVSKDGMQCRRRFDNGAANAGRVQRNRH